MEHLDFSTIPLQGIIVSPISEGNLQYAGSSIKKNGKKNSINTTNIKNKIEIDKYFNKDFIKGYFS